MQPSPTRDFTVGLFVLAGLGAIAYLSLQVGGLSYKGPGGFELYASFDEVGGLKPRAPVSISGVMVGRVEEVKLDPVSLRARVKLDLDPSLELSTDARAAVRTEGVLGNKFVSLDPGGEEELLQNGEEIAYTESAISLEGMIGKLMHNADLEGE